MRVLIACEESQRVCQAFRDRGHEAYSCDLIPTSGNHPEWHIMRDAIEVAYHAHWDMMIAHPPCTHLASAGATKWKVKRELGLQQQAIDFFMKLYNAPIDHIAIENPIGIMNTIFRKPDQIIQPFYFGDPKRKATCMWYKNMPKLVWTPLPDLFIESKYVEEEGPVMELVRKGPYRTGTIRKVYWTDALPQTKDRAKIRSKTFNGIAKAMAAQWG